MKFELEEYHRGVTDDELLSDLKRIASDLNKSSVTRIDYDDRGKYSTTTYVRRFGSWFNALEKAGLEKTRTPMNVPVEELFHNIEEMWAKLGRQPKYGEVLKPFSKYSVGTYEHRFGTWLKALRAFVDYMNEEGATLPEVTKSAKASKSTALHKTTRNINWRLRFLVMRRDNFKCKNCGRSPATDPSIILHVDHVKAWANGGETVSENLQTLCSKCNIGKSDLE